jgi:hypothetical protein
MDLDVIGLVKLRLGEHAVHSWDVAVALDSAATVSAEAVGLLIDGLGPLIGRAGRPAASPQTVHVRTTEPDREFVLDTGEPVRLDEASSPNDGPRLTLPSEALLRLVYGRLDPERTPPVDAAGVELDDLRKVFPGF